MNNIFEHLDPKQQEVVTTTEGPLLVFAGAGSGKTRSIIYRTAYLIKELGVPPWSVLIVTFTNKAAKELKERLQQHFEIDTKPFWVGTFHSICARILRIESIESYLGFDNSFTIFDKDDSQSIIRNVYLDLNITDKELSQKTAMNIISSAKNSLVETDNFFEIYAKNNVTYLAHKVYVRYEERLKESNGIDFDGLLMYTAKLLSENEDVRQKYRQQFSYVMVDEYQDTNYAQFYIVKKLVGDRGNLCVVGDDDQAIYSWRGATIKNILNFPSDFKKVKTIRLEQNYRSPQQILDRANQLISKNTTRARKVLWSEDKEGEEPDLQVSETDRDEVDNILNRYLQLRNDDPTGKETTVILYRTNAQSRMFETSCIEYNINYQIHGSVNFFQRKEIKDIISYLRVVNNPKDLESLLRVINFPPRGIGTVTVSKLTEYASRYGIPFLEAMKLASNIDSINITTTEKVSNLAFLIDNWSVKAQTTDITTLLEEICEATQIIKHYEKYTDHKDIIRLENIFELITAVREYADKYSYETGETPLLEGFLQDISLWTSLDSDFQTEDEPYDVLNMMTLHNAKGLEFDNVFITGIEEGLLPHGLCMDSSAAIEEERRLLYVGMTRARKRLFMSCSKFRRGFRGYESAKMSRFIADTFPDYVTVRRVGQSVLVSKENTSQRANIRIKPLLTTPSQPKPFQIGQRIKHRSFGEGIVLNVEAQKDDTKLTIKFDDDKLKKVMGSFVETLTD